MGWFRKKQPDDQFGYVDNAALKGIGGYQPADSKDATPDFLAQSPTPYAPPGTSTWTSSHTPMSHTPTAHTPTAHPTRPRDSSAPPAFPPAPPPRQPHPQLMPQSQPRQPQQVKKRARLGCLAVWVPLVVLGFLISNTSLFEDDSEPDSDRPIASYSPPPPEPEVVVPAAVEGWQSVAGADGRYAYDVPPSWTPAPGTIHGWEPDDKGPGITMSASAFKDPDICASGEDEHSRGGSGVEFADNSGAGRVARQTADYVAQVAFTAEGGPGPQVEVGRAKSVMLSQPDGEIEAKLAIARVTPRGDDRCLPDSALVGTIAVVADGQEKTPVLVVYTDQGYPGATTEQDVERILTSFRLVAEEDRETITPTPTR